MSSMSSMSSESIKQLEIILKQSIPNEVKVLISKPFASLKEEDAIKVLDLKMCLMSWNLLKPDDVKKLFDELDCRSEYFGMLILVSIYPGIICPYYNSSNMNYRIDTQWNGKFDSKLEMKIEIDRLIESMLYIFFHKSDYKSTSIEHLVQRTLFKNKSMAEEHNRLKRR